VVSFQLTVGFAGCRSSVSQANFAIYLVDTEEILLDGGDVVAFHADGGFLKLSGVGIEKWNSHLSHQGVPKLEDSLFGREFIIKIDGEELCRGVFWSDVSSYAFSGIVILDALIRMDADNNALSLRLDYPVGKPLPSDISLKLVRYFDRL
jgi:hypothetical protein